MDSGRTRRIVVLEVAFLLVVTLRGAASAPAEDLITSLPGQPSVNFNQYGGFITVDAENGRALYYYFVEAETNASTRPLILWLNGGPGCSSLGGAFAELGPFYTLTRSLVRNDKAWNQVSNVLFLESPAGVGFSYSNTSSDYNTGDNQTAQDSLTFLLEWFKKFPEYQQRDFFITGESYAGHYGPQLAAAVLKNNAVVGQAQIQLKGLMLGNPLFDEIVDAVSSSIVYLWSHGLISQATYDAIQSECKLNGSQESGACALALNETVPEAYNGTAVNPYDVLADVCVSFSSAAETRRLKDYVFQSVGLNLKSSPSPCIDEQESVYLNLPEVQSALHAKKTNWTMCTTTLNYSGVDVATSVLPVLTDILSSGLRLWVFSGDADSVVPLIGTRQLVGQVATQLNLTATSPYRVWTQGQQVGGWTVSWGNLTYATVRGAGHMVAETQPARALQLFASFISGTSLPF